LSRLSVSVPRTASGAESAAQYAKLKDFYRQAEEYGSAGVRQLENGRYRFYGELTPSRTPGEMAGLRRVRELDPSTGNTRTWFETLDHSGAVRQVRPETGGPKVHYFFDAEGNYGGTR
jgi:filamentous hemagglutinin